MDVRIYKTSKNVMQSGRAKTSNWVLEYELTSGRKPEPLMGWTSSKDTLSQVQITFESPDQAVEFAKSKGWSYTLLPERARVVKPRNYADNFKYVPVDKTERA